EAPPPADLRWRAPAGWVQGGAQPMRAVTFLVGAQQQSECYVTVLPGEAGGVAGNLNRWRKQMGQGELDDAAIAGLPKLQAFGAPVPVVEAAGDFADMQGKRHTGYLLVGVV